VSAGDTMVGRRVLREDPMHFAILAPGEFTRYGGDGNWYGCTPNGHQCGLAKHDVTEHEDGTITVSPSILVGRGSAQLWHGYLERGVWREV
jgi:hypothetical protein